ncbi:MAG: hypothetical protein HQK67_09770 [Desulfamplus sp.]|nr:hypothetical protein [Desulfamplus sp.]
MRVIDYGLQPFSSGDESEELIAKAQHFVESAKKTAAIVYQVDSVSSYWDFIAVSNGIEFKISLDANRDLKSVSLINECDPIHINKIYTLTIPYQRKYGIPENLNQNNNTIQCRKCGKMTILYGWMQFCSHCGDKVSSDKLKFCPTCKDNMVFSPSYTFCSTCGDKLLEHPDEAISPLEFNADDLLIGVEIHAEYMNYDKIIPQAQANEVQNQG